MPLGPLSLTRVTPRLLAASLTISSDIVGSIFILSVAVILLEVAFFVKVIVYLRKPFEKSMVELLTLPVMLKENDNIPPDLVTISLFAGGNDIIFVCRLARSSGLGFSRDCS